MPIHTGNALKISFRNLFSLQMRFEGRVLSCFQVYSERAYLFICLFLWHEGFVCSPVHTPTHHTHTQTHPPPHTPHPTSSVFLCFCFI